MARIFVLGDINLDLQADLPASFPIDGELRTNIEVQRGGAAANFAVAAVRAGVIAELVGCVGNDIVGKFLEQSLIKAGVITHLQHTYQPSGVLVSLRSNDVKTMLCSRGANDMLKRSFIDPKWFVGIDHLHISGYSILSKSQSSAAKHAIEIAQSKGIRVSIDPPPANLIASFGAKRFLSSIKAAWCIFPNLAEAKVLTDNHDPQGMVSTLSAQFAVGALTMGSEGSIAWEERERSFKKPEMVFDVDSTGAGDAFAAGFIVSYLADSNLEKANQEGSEASLRLLLERSSAKRS